MPIFVAVGCWVGCAVGVQRPEYKEYPDKHEVHVEESVHAEQPVGQAVKTNDAQSELPTTPSPGVNEPNLLIHPAACKAAPNEVHPGVVAQ